LDDIRKERNRTSREREKLEKARAKLEAQTRDLEKRLEKIEDERRETLAKARAEGELEVAVLKQNMDSLKSQLKKAKQPLEAIKAIEEKIEKIEEKVEQPVERRQTVDHGPSSSAVHRQWSLGERVTVRSLNAEGLVTALGESDAEVQIGTLRVRARLSDLVRKSSEQSSVSSKAKETITRESSVVQRQSSSPGMEVDLRGLMAEDALDKMERYLEQAFLSGLPFVRIIHGKGTGRLRQAVREALRGHEYVNTFEEGGSTEGGEGVTVAKMKSG